MTKNILFVTTNSSGEGKIENTGVYLEEFAVPYLIFEKTGYNIDSASPKGGLSPVDENSLSCSNPVEWDKCIKILRETKKLDELNFEKYDAVYFPGGHGPMFDLPFSDEIKKCVEYFYNSNKIIAAICHGVVALTSARDKENEPIVKNKKITSFTNKEEQVTKLGEFLPFLLETRLKELGANFIEQKSSIEHVEVEDKIITGQNQHASTLIAEKIIEKLG